MARSIYFMAFLVLAMTLFVAHGVKGQNICKTTSKYFKGLCITDSSCRKVCIEKDKFEDGHCSKLQRKCLCTKLCAFDNIPNDAGAILVQDVKTLEAELLEEEIFRA
ncbi:flower-specific defensin-like [Capsicum annuum]|uniref:flower-specific defensin-like n=1 Tax=Capsicum annuum TaxID=4072 RepID=UPI001FB09DE8|nr:flower-specific defensin-like [Capsicum annuum]